MSLQPSNINVKFGPGGIMKHPGSVEYRAQGKMLLVEWILQRNLSLDDRTLLETQDEIKEWWLCSINDPERKRIADALISSLIFKGVRFWDRDKTKQWFVVYDHGYICNKAERMLKDQIKTNVSSLVRLACRLKTCEASNHQGSLPVCDLTPVSGESYRQLQHTTPIQQPRQEIFSSQFQLSHPVSHHTPQEYSQELDQSSTCHQIYDNPTHVDCPDDDDALWQSLFDDDKWLDA
jgi:hypothetical protein